MYYMFTVFVYSIIWPMYSLLNNQATHVFLPPLTINIWSVTNWFSFPSFKRQKPIKTLFPLSESSKYRSHSKKLGVRRAHFRGRFEIISGRGVAQNPPVCQRRSRSAVGCIRTKLCGLRETRKQNTPAHDMWNVRVELYKVAKTKPATDKKSVRLPRRSVKNKILFLPDSTKENISGH